MVKIRCGDIDPNPFRDFNLYPIDRVKVDFLATLIESTGFNEDLVVRPRPDKPGRYQQAYGHHRLAAVIKLYGEDHKIANIQIDDFDDLVMLRKMIGENEGQDGKTVAARIDATAALVGYGGYLLTRFRNQASCLRFSADMKVVFKNEKRFDIARGQFLSGKGIGRPLLKELSGHAIEREELGTAIGALKSSGDYDRIVALAYDKAIVDQRADDAEIERAAEEARVKAEEAAEELNRKRAAAKRREEQLEAAAAAAEEAKQQQAADLAEKQRLADEAEAAAKEKQRDVKRAEKERDKANEVKDTTQASLKLKDKQDKKGGLRPNLTGDAPELDIRVSQLFTVDAHLSAFRAVVTSDAYKPYYPVGLQFKAAQEIVTYATKHDIPLTANFIAQMLRDYAKRHVIDPDKVVTKNRLLVDNDLKAEDAWEKLRLQEQKVVAFGKKLVDALKAGAKLPARDYDSFEDEVAILDENRQELVTELRKAAKLTGRRSRTLEGEVV